MANSVGTITRSSVWSARTQSTPLETAPLCRQRAASFSFSCSLPLSKSSSCTYVSMTYLFFFLSASPSYVCAWLYVQFLHVLPLHYVRNRCLNRICEEIWCKFLPCVRVCSLEPVFFPLRLPCLFMLKHGVKTSGRTVFV
jgi:hypothetical protein